MSHAIGIHAAGFGLVVLVACSFGHPEDVNRPAAAPELRAEGLLLGRCTVCHSTDLITQQRLHTAKWRATVNKMVGWGAQLSAAEQKVLVAYLSSRYHPDAPEVIDEAKQPAEGAPSVAAGSGSAAPEGQAPRGAAVYAHNCLPCHGEAAAGGMGPKLAGNPILNRDEAFQQTVMQGRGAMPAWGAILKPQEIADVHAWLKSLR